MVVVSLLLASLITPLMAPAAPLPLAHTPPVLHHAAPPPLVETRPGVSVSPRFPRAATRYSIGDPTAQEQFILELINRARRDPYAEGIRLAGTLDPEIQSAYQFFGVDLAVFLQQMQGVAPAPPLAMNARLLAAARLHSQDMYANAYQGHTGTDGSTPSQRVSAQGYNWRTSGENVFAYARSEEYAHAGMEVDWGTDHTGCTANGMQCALGHRRNNHDTVFREAGIALINGSNGTVGPMVLTEEFATDQAETPLITGVVYFDFNNNGFYDMGEGIPGVRVDVAGSSYYAISASAGGYAVPVPGPGSYTVSFSGGGLPSYSKAVSVPQVVSTAGDNVQLDDRIYSPPPTITRGGDIAAGKPVTISATMVDGYTAYQWEIAERTTTITPEGGEGGLAPWRIDVYTGWNILDTSVVASGTHSIHLVMPEFKPQIITLLRHFRPTAASRLQFFSRLGWASTVQTARVQVSEDDGASWIDLWSQNGTGSAGEAAFTLRQVDLSAYAGRRIMLRFAYDPYTSGSYFPQTDVGVGWYIDDITVTNAEELINARTVQTPGDRYTWTPTATGSFTLRARAQVAGGGFTRWGTGRDLVVAQQPGGNGVISGVVMSNSATPGDLYALVATDAGLQHIVAMAPVDPTSGGYRVTGLIDGAYHLAAIVDVNRNGAYDAGEPMARLPAKVTISGGNAVSAADLTVERYRVHAWSGHGQAPASAGSGHPWNNNPYWVQLEVDDPYQWADSVVVTGDGIGSSLMLVYDPYQGRWSSSPQPGNVLFGQSAPTVPLHYNFVITDAYGQHTIGDSVGFFVQNMVTGVLPADGSVVSATPQFSWTGVADAGASYGIALRDGYGQTVWSVSGLTQNGYAYTGPALTSGARYDYIVSVCLPDGLDCNLSEVAQRFTYQPGGGSVGQRYTLQAGWNLISFPMDPGPNGIADFIAAVRQAGGAVASIWAYDPTRAGSPWRSYVVAAPAVADLTSIQAGVGYWVRLTRGASVTLSGSKPATNAPVLHSGWNLIGVDAPVGDLSTWLGGLGASSVWCFDGRWWSSYRQGVPVFLNSLQRLDAGVGYYLWLAP